MRRHCGRPGCNAVATATFSFDATRCVVWLNPIEDGMPRAGDLCTRHADGMAPPKGWERIDKRPLASPRPPVGTDPAESQPRKSRTRSTKRTDGEPNLFEGPAAAPTAPAVEVQGDPVPQEPATPDAGWMPRYATDDDLDGVLDASTPLLARAFNNARPVEDGDTDESADPDGPASSSV